MRSSAAQQIPQIMSEMQDAADVLQSVGWCVAVFGSARIAKDSPYYTMAQTIGQRLAAAGLPLIAGGGPGIMEAANKGAYEAGGVSVGLNIKLQHESKGNDYQTHRLNFEYFFSRKATFFMHSAAYIALPGGMGTLDELFEVLTLMQTRKVPLGPIVLMGTDFWPGLLDWMRQQLERNQLIAPGELDRIIVTDDADEVMAHIQAFCREHAGELCGEATLPE